LYQASSSKFDGCALAPGCLHASGIIQLCYSYKFSTLLKYAQIRLQIMTVNLAQRFPVLKWISTPTLHKVEIMTVNCLQGTSTNYQFLSFLFFLFIRFDNKPRNGIFAVQIMELLEPIFCGLNLMCLLRSWYLIRSSGTEFRAPFFSTEHKVFMVLSSYAELGLPTTH
jgi:hypothetical protein